MRSHTSCGASARERLWLPQDYDSASKQFAVVSHPGQHRLHGHHFQAPNNLQLRDVPMPFSVFTNK